MDMLIHRITVGVIAFCLGIDVYLLWKIFTTKRKLAPTKIPSYRKMTNALIWLYINQIMLISLFISPSQIDKAGSGDEVEILDFVLVAVLISVILFNIHMIRNYITEAINGKLFNRG